MKRMRARYAIGQRIRHKLYNYRGVIIDVDATYQGSNEWYETIAVSRPPKHEPWYHVLVHGAVHRTYVSERNIESDTSADPIEHPELSDYFVDFKDGMYILYQQTN